MLRKLIGHRAFPLNSSYRLLRPNIRPRSAWNIFENVLSNKNGRLQVSQHSSTKVYLVLVDLFEIHCSNCLQSLSSATQNFGTTGFSKNAVSFYKTNIVTSIKNSAYLLCRKQAILTFTW
jgi:hypothetical protein